MPTQAIEEAVDQAVSRVPTALRTIQNYYGLRNEDIAQLIGKNTNWVQERTSGKRSCKIEDLFRFAAGLEVPAELLIQDRDDVYRWLIDNPAPAWAGGRSGWTHQDDLVGSNL